MTTQHDHATEHRHVLIIGNGFDLQHGFKTRYGDFAKWLDDNRDQHHDNVWSQYVVRLYRQNTATHDQKTWIDLEKEIEVVIGRFHSIVWSAFDTNQLRWTELQAFQDALNNITTDDSQLQDLLDQLKREGKPFRFEHFLNTWRDSFRHDFHNGIRREFRTKIDITKSLKSKFCEFSIDEPVHLLLANKKKLIVKSLFGCPIVVHYLGSDDSEHQIDIFWQKIPKKLQEQICELTVEDTPTSRQDQRQTLNAFISFLYGQLQRLIDQFDLYLQSVFKGIEDQTAIKESPFRLDHLVKPPIECDPIPWAWSTTNVVSFNYTHTYQAIGKERCPTVDDQVIHIHGQMGLHGQMGQHNMVLGTRTMDHPGSTEWHRFHKHTQRMVKDTISRYQDLLADIKKAHKVTIGVVGHSLDTSDHAILKHLLMANPNTRVRVYYHSTDHLVAMNHNITTIMGEDAVSEKVRFICQYDHHDDGSHNPDGVFET